MAIEPLEPPASEDLATLAAEISRAHYASKERFEEAVTHAIQAGELLLTAKERVGHGGWLTWLAGNFPASVRTAQNYMRLARYKEDAQRVAYLGVGAAVRALQSGSPNKPLMLSEVELEYLRTRDGWLEFLACARSFLEIRDKALYRTSYPSFVAYLEERWALNRSTTRILDLAEAYV